MATNTTASFTDHTGNNTAGPFSISFSYLAQSEVKVYVDGVLKTVTTHYTFPSTTTISFTSGNHPASGALIKFQRSTDVSTKRADFSDGSVLTEADLDANADQMIYSVQELIEEVYTSASATPPANPQSGSRWFDSVSGRTYVYYIDTDSSQWVEMSPAFDGKVNNAAIATQDLADNQKIRWGNGFDLEMFHDGSNSYIKDAGVGDLIISSGTDTSAKFITDGAVELYHNNAKKIETTANGVTVTGGITASGALDANGGASIDNIQIGVTGDNEIDTATGDLTIDSAGGNTTIDDNVTISGNLTLSNGVLNPKSISGDRFGIIPHVDSTGVMEVGLYIDFHPTDGNTGDRDLRIAAVNNAAATKILGMNWPGTASYYPFITSSALNINHINWVDDSTDYIQFHHLNSSNAAAVVGIFINVSDGNLKENIEDSTYDALDCIKKLKLRDFDWKPGFKTGSVKCGLVAQEVETVNSSFVIDVKDGYKQLNSDRMVQVSLKAIQELLSKVEALETKVAALEVK